MQSSILTKITYATLLVASLTLIPSIIFAHGDVTPQAVDTKDLPPLGEDWREENPYRGNKAAIKTGSSAYNQNCARCHGLDAISGGFSPDLRLLDRDCVNQKSAERKQACFKNVDAYYLGSIRAGKVRNGAVYMPPFEGFLKQEAMWAIKAYLETVRASE